MSPTTANRAYPYPASTDAPRVWEDMQELAAAVDTDVQSLIPTYSTWTPTLTSLTVGTGAVTSGWYWTLGKIVVAQLFVRMGTSPSWSGTVQVSLPVAAYANGELDIAVGSWSYRDDSATTWYAGTVATFNTAGTSVRMVGAWDGTAPRSALGSGGNTPVALASGDKLSLQLSYRVA